MSSRIRRATLLVVSCLACLLPQAAEAGQVAVTIRPARAAEGHALSFVVALSRSPARMTTVDFATIEGTADDSSDFVARAGTLRFRPGMTKRRVEVAANTDVQDEPDENMTVVLSKPTRARINRDTADGTIEDVNGPPTVSIADTSASEGDDLEFPLSLSEPSGNSVSVDVTADDATQTVTFPPGHVTNVAVVPTSEDEVDGGDRTVTASLADAVNATIADGEATGTVVDDDTTVPAISIGDASEPEGSHGAGGSMRFPVTLSAPSDATVTAHYATGAGTADAQDFAAMDGSIRFLPGETAATLAVPVTGDDRDEEDEESFTVALDSPTNATIEDGDAVGVISDDDATPALSIDDVIGEEPNRGQTDWVFTVTLSAPSGRAVSVDVATADGSARTPSDYVAVGATLVFEPGVVTAQVAVPVVGDRKGENREQFVVELSNAANATIERDAGYGTIRDSD